MRLDFAPEQRRFLAPEVMQTSAMDCGPAALKCLLEGFGISASYGRLREVCQTSVDGTSIDMIEDVAVQLGLVAEQTMVPADHLLLSDANLLPSLVVTMQPNGLTHFVVAWRYHWGFVQVMDPATGRRWVPYKKFLGEVYRHQLPMSATVWRAWAGSEGFCAPLRQRLTQLGLDDAHIAALIDEAREGTEWQALGTLDAATRIVTAVVQSGGLTRGPEAGELIRYYFHQAQKTSPGSPNPIPLSFWSVQPASSPPPQPTDGTGPTPAAENQVLLRGAVLVCIRGRRDPRHSRVRSEAAPTPAESALSPDTRVSASDTQAPAPDATATTTDEPLKTDEPLAPDLAAALNDPPSRPEFEMVRALRADGLLTPSALAIAVALAATGLTGEALLLRGFMDLSRYAGLSEWRLQLMGATGALALILLLLELPISHIVLRLGRRLETRLRLAFLTKLPRLGDRYFHSRLTSDMTQRAHSLRQVRNVPSLGSRFLRLSCQLLLTMTGIIWLAPGSAILAILAALWAVGTALLTYSLLTEHDMRVRTHIGALSRFYLDALLGLVPVRTHGSEQALRREHESLLVEWARASLSLVHLEAAVKFGAALISSGLAIWIVLAYVSQSQGGSTNSTLLLLYWTLGLPLLGQWLVELVQQYTVQRNSVLRFLEPLAAPEETESDTGASTENPSAQPPHPPNPRGLSIRMEDVDVHIGGHRILREINLTIQPGEHLAIIGASGAGKSSLVSLLLGWHQPSAGRVWVDDSPLLGPQLPALRHTTAWIDPAVQLWNRSLLDNLYYGTGSTSAMPLNHALAQADLLQLLEQLPDGLQTHLGEGGGLVSGGEGQRVRLGRALLRPNVRLAILDEPFRGLDRPKRRALLAATRQHWQHITFLCITHDVSETRNFDRVVVLDAGRIVEDQAPAVLAEQPESRYRALLEAEIAMRKEMWEQVNWRRLWLANGQLRETREPPQDEADEGYVYPS